MKRSIGLRGIYGVRALAALLMIAGFFAAGTATALAQDDESGLDGNSFTSPNFDWSVEWDEDVWTFEVDSEDNAGGSDFFQLTTVDDPFAIATFYAGTGYDGDPDDCAEGYEDTLSGLDGNSDVDETDDFELPETPEDGAAAVYTYTAELDSGDLDLVDYVSCQTVVEDEAVLIFSITTTPNVFEDLIPAIDDLTAEITLPDDLGRGSQDDEEDETPEADDETPEADEDETPEADDEDAEPTRDVLLGDDEEEETPAADDDERRAESGIDDTTYTSPTYGFSVEWDEDVWTADPDGEVIDDGADGLDRLRLTHQDDDGFYSSFYVEGKEDYDGDTTDCLEGEADLLSSENAVVDFAPYEDEDGDPIEGEADSGGEFAVFVATIETEDGDEVDLIEHVECQTLEEGESVVVFTLLTTEDIYEDELDAALEVIDSLEIDGGRSARDDSAEDEDNRRSSADDDEPTEEADSEDDRPSFDGPDDDAEPTEEPTDEEDETARAPLAAGHAV